jgi:hypothetical protein
MLHSLQSRNMMTERHTQEQYEANETLFPTSHPSRTREASGGICGATYNSDYKIFRMENEGASLEAPSRGSAPCPHLRRLESRMNLIARTTFLLLLVVMISVSAADFCYPETEGTSFSSQSKPPFLKWRIDRPHNGWCTHDFMLDRLINRAVCSQTQP